MQALCVTPERKVVTRELAAPSDPPAEHLIVRMEACTINPGDKFFLNAPSLRELPSSQHGVWGASGAGTVVVAAEGSRRVRSLQGHEARVLALLSAAYGNAVAPSVVGNITRAAKAWSEGDDCLAYIHLAHARLPTLREPYDAAQRLSSSTAS